MAFNLFAKKKTEKPAESNSQEVVATPQKSGNIEGARDFREGLVSTKDIIAPTAIEVDFNHIRIDNKYYRTLFIAGYPRFVGINWLSTLINFDASLSVSMYVYPTDGKEVLDDLRRKIAEMEAELTTDIQRGRIVNPATQAKLEDALNLQQDLVKGEERFFQFGLYVTISATEKEDLDKINKNLESALGSLMIISKKATLQMEEGFLTTLPTCDDKLKVTRNMDTTSLATTFPFVSSDLSDDKGIMYGINEHNGSLVVFDRFSMPNYNSVVFATSGAGKSYMVKLELIRSLMFGTEIIVIDPENEYKDLCEAVGGQYVAFGSNEESKINPFDLSLLLKNDEDATNALNNKILSLHKLFKVMMGEMDPLEESMLDRAVMMAYKAKGISPDPESQTKEPPLLEDLYKSLIGMEEDRAKQLAARLEKYIKGSFAGVFNQKTTVDLKNKFVVFGIRNLEDSLRPVAMHIILDYVWTIVKASLKRRIMVVDEAWYMMQYEDSASFLRSIVKRGRKYYLGVTTITQDVGDFLKTAYGKDIVTNSSIQILLKQHSAAIDEVGDTFYLSEGEKQLLLSADKGEGIFFAGQNHVAIRVIASESEHKLITSDPEELLRMKQQSMDLKIEPEIKMTKPSPSPATNSVGKIDSDSNKVAGEDDKLDNDDEGAVVIETGIKQQELQDSHLHQDYGGQVRFKKTDLGMATETTGGEEEEKEVDNPVSQTEPTEELSDLEKRIAEMEVAEKAKVAEYEKKTAEEEAKKKVEEEKNKTLYNSGLPKYQDLFKSYSPPTANSKPQIPSVQTSTNGQITGNPNKASIGSGVLPPLPVTPQAPMTKLQEPNKVQEQQDIGVVREDTQKSSKGQVPIKKTAVLAKKTGQLVNPFGPKSIPEPDLTKVNPSQALGTSPSSSTGVSPVKLKEEKIERGKVKVEVEETNTNSKSQIPSVQTSTNSQITNNQTEQTTKSGEKKDDKKAMSYDDLFGN